MARGTQSSNRSILKRSLMKLCRRAVGGRRVFANSDKIALVDKWRTSSLSMAAFERAHALPVSAILKWRTLGKSIKSADPAGFSRKAAAHQRLEVELMRWLRKCWSWKCFRVSGSMVQQQARAIGKDLKISDFIASGGWLEGFRARNGLTTVRLHGERASADHAAALEYPEHFRKVIADLNVPHSHVFNADQTLLYPRLQLSTTICPWQTAKVLRAGKKDKFRIGMMVTTSADGKSDCPLVFSHTAERPRGMVNLGYKPVQEHVQVSEDGGHYYYHTHNGWISRDAVAHYLTYILPRHIRSRTQEQKPYQALLLLDGCGIHYTAMFDLWLACHQRTAAEVCDGPVKINCTGYVAKTRSTYVPAPPRSPEAEQIMQRIRRHGTDLTFSDGVLHVRSLPPNTTCELQPCDQGLISSLKARWRAELDTRSLAVRSGTEAAHFARKVHVMDVMFFLSDCARNIPPETGRRYWAPLLDAATPTYAEALEESMSSTTEAILAVQEKIWDE